MSTFGKTWWGQRLIEATETFTDPKRLIRGRQYLSTHRILGWQVERNKVQARVRGRMSPYLGFYEEPVYEIRIEFLPLPESAWDSAIRLIGDRAGFLARLLLNEMPDEIEKPFDDLGIDLLPRSRKDLKARCSCPDPENPCKHIAALYYLLASRLDHDPFLLFELRGLPRSELARRLQATPLGAALAVALTEDAGELRSAESYFSRPKPIAVPETVAPKDYWRSAKKLPSGVEPPEPAPVSGILVKKGGDFPPFWPKDVSFVEVMDAFYEQVRKRAKDWM
ncbi:SWIM zinc finger family protein [Methylocaldum sp.]|uniref:SWIM zinc finger family protein n=1 Tax=Methylocaldum sp. TaxID=1969727 RepID=UPI002D3BAE59|nr:SWIM zinc finger family protein [Methylocaldum sp.]HYE37279.1 SWIM zinc finger family protein [Methylocaldum sp.]